MIGWIENTGIVPEGVTKDTVIEVFYRDTSLHLWGANEVIDNDDPLLWVLLDMDSDILWWRFVEDTEESLTNTNESSIKESQTQEENK